MSGSSTEVSVGVTVSVIASGVSGDGVCPTDGAAEQLDKSKTTRISVVGKYLAIFLISMI